MQENVKKDSTENIMLHFIQLLLQFFELPELIL
jgi:hypothetical protein